MHSADAATAEEAIAAQDALDVGITSEEATEVAMQNTLLTPRFYTTDFDEMDAIDVTPVRAEWDRLIAGMKADPNKGHFKKTDA
jgi:magnesium-protoporphyrin IX monomethyl ester (oxidative) cyclase